MRAQGMKALTVTFKNGKTKDYVFETEEKALVFYFKYKEHKLIDKITLNYTNTFKRHF